MFAGGALWMARCGWRAVDGALCFVSHARGLPMLFADNVCSMLFAARAFACIMHAKYMQRRNHASITSEGLSPRCL